MHRCRGWEATYPAAPRPSTILRRLWVRSAQPRPAHLRNFPQKNWKRGRLPTSTMVGKDALGRAWRIAIRCVEHALAEALEANL